jgi:TPP-dependent pyruvate/acetoin dehydrogenase alpha subunit
MAIPRERLLPLLETMLLMRRLEEQVCELGPKEVFGNYHVYIGQEATGACVIDLLDPEDPIFTTHRNHAHALARGIPPEQILAELLLRATGASGGKGGTQHVMSAERHVVATSIVGGSTILATGAALAAQVLGDGRMGVAFLGDRTVQEGGVAEALNLAALWELPVLYVCENNDAASDLRRLGSSLREVSDLARTYGLRVDAVDGTDPGAVYSASEALVEHVRSARRPAFLETRTPAWPGRAGPSLDVTGRTEIRHAWAPPEPDALEAWHRADPVLRTVRLALEEEVASEEGLLALDARAQEAVGKATAAALAAPFPPSEAAFADVWAGGDLWPR